MEKNPWTISCDGIFGIGISIGGNRETLRSTPCYQGKHMYDPGWHCGAVESGVQAVRGGSRTVSSAGYRYGTMTLTKRPLHSIRGTTVLLPRNEEQPSPSAAGQRPSPWCFSIPQFFTAVNHRF